MSFEKDLQNQGVCYCFRLNRTEEQDDMMIELSSATPTGEHREIWPREYRAIVDLCAEECEHTTLTRSFFIPFEVGEMVSINSHGNPFTFKIKKIEKLIAPSSSYSEPGYIFIHIFVEPVDFSVDDALKKAEKRLKELDYR